MNTDLTLPLRFSQWIEKKTDDLQKAGDGYEALTELSKKVLDTAIERYVLYRENIKNKKQ
jgi:hypothetical protein